ncbi:mCG144952, partial [Mus musculus]
HPVNTSERNRYLDATTLWLSDCQCLPAVVKVLNLGFLLCPGREVTVTHRTSRDTLCRSKGMLQTSILEQQEHNRLFFFKQGGIAATLVRSPGNGVCLSLWLPSPTHSLSEPSAVSPFNPEKSFE